MVRVHGRSVGECQCVSESEILKDSTDVHNFFTSFGGGHVFRFRSRKSDGILSTGLQAGGSTIKQEDKTGMRSMGIGVTGPISIYPPRGY
jgi:hypothetical protein